MSYEINNNEKVVAKIYGNNLGTVAETIDFLSSLENAYNSIVAFELMLSSSTQKEKFNYRKERDNSKISSISISNSVEPIIHVYNSHYEQNNEFVNYEKTYDVISLISPENHLRISKISFNSPGVWEVVGLINPLQQLRDYIKERHSRNKDIKFGWKQEEKAINIALEKQERENERLAIQNDIEKIKAANELGVLLKNWGYTEVEIRAKIDHYIDTPFKALNSHIDIERVIEIGIIEFKSLKY